MRKRIKTIFDLLERIHVAGYEVDIMSTVRRELVLLDHQAKTYDHSGPPGEPGVDGKEEENG